jgi:hypothetical protein
VGGGGEREKGRGDPRREREGAEDVNAWHSSVLKCARTATMPGDEGGVQAACASIYCSTERAFGKFFGCQLFQLQLGGRIFSDASFYTHGVFIHSFSLPPSLRPTCNTSKKWLRTRWS